MKFKVVAAREPLPSVKLYSIVQPKDLKEAPSLSQCEDILQNYLATGIGTEYVQGLLKYVNVKKLMQQASLNLFSDRLDHSLSDIDSNDLFN